MNHKVVPLRPRDGAGQTGTDEDLLQALAGGDLGALGALFDRHYRQVRSFLARMAGTDDRDVDDLVQITFETLQRAARHYDGRASAKTFVFGVAANVARHHVRTEVRHRRKLAAVAALPDPRPPDVDDEAIARERAARLTDAIAQLPPKLREAFVLVYLENHPGREVAAMLGVREGTIWKRLHQARSRLRALLEDVRE